MKFILPQLWYTTGIKSTQLWDQTFLDLSPQFDIYFLVLEAWYLIQARWSFLLKALHACFKLKVKKRPKVKVLLARHYLREMLSSGTFAYTLARTVPSLD